MEGYLDIIELWQQGQSISEISRRTGDDRKTVRPLVEHGPPGPRMPRQVSSKLDPFREYLIKRLIENKVTNAAVLFDEIRARGYEGGRSLLWDFLRPLRSVLEDKVTVRFETPPGKQAPSARCTAALPACHGRAAQRFHRGGPGRGGIGPRTGDGRGGTASVELFRRRVTQPYMEAGVDELDAAPPHERAFHFLGGVPEEVLYDRNAGLHRPAGVEGGITMKTVWLRDDHRDAADQRLPEPWNGDIEHAPLLFVASNPSIDEAEIYAKRDQHAWSDDLVMQYLRRRF